MNTIKYSVSEYYNAMNKENPVYYAARIQLNKVVPSKDFVKHISDHNGVFSRGTVKGVTTDLVSCLREMLVAGNKVEIEGLGSFAPSLSCKESYVDSIEKFTAADIKAVNVVFTPSEDLQNLIDDCEFEQVTSRKAQAAALKAVKACQTVVDLTGGKADSGASGSDAPETDNGGGATIPDISDPESE